ncbi:hypothetical protein ABEB36_005069 [Hypothenemus hampei]
MATFPTPPSSSGDSPVYFVASPNSNHFSVSSPELSHPYVQTNILPSDTTMLLCNNTKNDGRPYLKFIEQPTNKFRFRYKSEMAGTHGSLCGINSDKSRKQTYPTVELVNFPAKAVIRCSIYQYNVTTDFKPHPHRLIMKKGKEEIDDPHDLEVGPDEGFTATFHSMGIIHTARKNIISELVKKKAQLKRECVATLEGKARKLTEKELLEIKGLAEQESKSINLNIVCLRFDAYLIKNGIRNPICPPIFSHGINNLKCALTGDLKIVRMDHCTSPAKGGKEIFLLVERVTKKNIKIRFFELDDDEQEIWEGWGKFSELDVHHQYAIVFKTPPYDRNLDINRPVNVYMQLVRPSDNARSEWKDFRFVPSSEFRPGSKRSRSNYDSSSSFNSNSMCSNDIPATIPTMISHQQLAFTNSIGDSWNQDKLFTDDQLSKALNDIHSDEFNKLFDSVSLEMPSYVFENVVDSPISISDRLNNVHIGRHSLRSRNISGYNFIKDHRQRSSHSSTVIVKMEVSQTDLLKAERTYNELRSFIKSTDASERAPQMLEHYLGEENERRNNALHVFISLNRKEEVTFLLKMLVLSKKFELTNVPNVNNLTPLHIAVQCRNEEFVTYLLNCHANSIKQDNYGKTALHMAVKLGATPSMIELLINPNENKRALELIDMEDYDGMSALNYAVENRNMTYVKLLCKFGADVNKKNAKNGFTPLRMAIENQFSDAINYFLNHPSFILSLQNDFKNLSPFEAAAYKQSNGDILQTISAYMIQNGIEIESKKEVEDEEEDEDEEMEEIDVKPDLLELPIENPETFYDGLKKLPTECLDEVATILDSSGKYTHLADLLDLTHLLESGVLASEHSVSKNILRYAIEVEKVNILDIRNFLENLDEDGAVAIMDRTASSLQTLVKK